MANQGFSSKGLVGVTFNNRWIARKHLGGGSFGDVYEAEDIETQSVVALKFETGNAVQSQLPNEYKCYSALQGSPNIPKVYGLFDYKKSTFLVMERMGASLESCFKRNGKRFSLKTILMIGDQLFRCIEYIHKSGILHRDIKPHNFLIGLGENRRQIYAIDFGVSTRYIDPKTKEHQIYSPNNGLIGTAHYVSVNTHLGESQSRRDDLESIAYVLIRFLRGSLPWQKIKIKDPDERQEKISQMKLQTTPEQLCFGIPSEFRQIYEYIRRLRYDETPNYSWIRQTLQGLFNKQGFVNDGIYDWDFQASIHRPLPSIYLMRAATAYIRLNERKIKPRDEYVKYPKGRRIFYNEK
ncbi:CK1 family protein kinase [Trichomonas vaginalis G3]|uniref:non-specific serine/threonine protein kinase n=1 Tax=Trichomonas vaginalis (strain ATCC PRA-98 / G3) TaxID=412133 RepID=A2DN88_TRIV3|nr:STKc CK1 domain-containing protein [Trichomonas vaginalis G3]EAY18076.1 CK1 family protein kinase [Trichomonas vaginalis G3]KAI5492351.1 STKc CK1 domain-containing protein [Trichomonas vaginalis G3]|eukprot:XP_001579062.1 CK1 family protein kinase [Trichomonas vaginalis G3]